MNMANNDSCYRPPWSREEPAYRGDEEETQQDEDMPSGGLGEIISLLNQIKKTLSAQGVLDFFESSVDSTGVVLEPQAPDERWLKVSIENAGSNNLYVKINGQSSNSKEPYIAPGGTFSFDIGKNVISSVELRATANTTTSYRVYAVK